MTAEEQPRRHRPLAGRFAPTRATKLREASPLDTVPGRAVFVVGGSLLAASAVGDLVSASLFAATIRAAARGGAIDAGFPAVAELVFHAMFAASIVLFAVGARGGGSVVGRRPLGTTALVVCALASLAPALVDAIPGGSAVAWLGAGQWLFIAAGLVGAIEIVRVRAIAGWTRFLPLALVAGHLLFQLALVWVVSSPAEGWSQLGYAALLLLVGLPALSLLTLAIGICALVAGLRARSPQRERIAAEAGPAPLG